MVKYICINTNVVPYPRNATNFSYASSSNLCFDWIRLLFYHVCRKHSVARACRITQQTLCFWRNMVLGIQQYSLTPHLTSSINTKDLKDTRLEFIHCLSFYCFFSTKYSEFVLKGSDGRWLSSNVADCNFCRLLGLCPVCMAIDLSWRITMKNP